MPNPILYPKKQRIYVTVLKGDKEYMLGAIVIEKDGSFYSVDAGAPSKPTPTFTAYNSGSDTATISSGPTKHTRHPDGRHHFQSHTGGQEGFRTVKDSVAKAPPYFIKGGFRILGFRLSGPLKPESYPLFLKQKARICFDYSTIQPEADLDFVLIHASVEGGRNYPNLEEAIKDYACRREGAIFTPRQYFFHNFEYNLPPLLLIAATWDSKTYE